MFTLVREAPDEMTLVRSSWRPSPALETRWEAELLAAGDLENIIVNNGEHVIGRVGDLARRSPRFRFILSGVWSQGPSGTEV